MKPSIRSLALALFTFLQSSIALSDAPLIWGPNNTARLLNSGDLTAKNGYIYPNTPSAFTVGSIPFATAGTTLSEDNANLYWDNVYQRLSIGTNFTTSKLTISGGDTSVNFANASIGLGYSNTGRYSQFIHTRHAAGTSIGNYIDFYTSDGASFSLYPTNAVFGMTVGNGNVGIGTTAPAKAFDVAGKFQVDSNGNILKINNVATSFPASQGAANTPLTNNGSGSLTWASSTSLGGSAATDSNVFANGNSGNNVIVNPPVYIAQRFTANATGNFVSYETKMQNYVAATGVVLQAELWSDNGLSGTSSDIGSLLASSTTTISDSTLLTAGSVSTATSSIPSSIYNFTPYPVVSGTLYWVVVRKISGSLGANFILATSNTATTSPPARAPGNVPSGFTPTTYFKANVLVPNQFVLSNASNYLDSSFLNYNVNFGGNVLSGVSTPLVSTDAANKAYVDASVFTGTTGSVVFIGPSGTLTQDNPKFFWDDTNNRLGIGTSAPATSLHVSGASAIFGTGEGATPGASIIRGAAAVGTNIAGASLTLQASNGTGLGGSGVINFQTAPVGTTGSTVNTLATAMTINNTGNVGIGTTTTPSRLSLFGTTTEAFSAYTQSPSATSIRFGTNSSSNNSFLGTFNYVGSGNVGNYTSLGLAGLPMLYLSGGGNVGIGTSAPAAPLHVSGASAIFGTGENTATPGAATIRGANASGTDKPGANLTLQASNGTGLGGSGVINFQTAIAGTTGSTANTLVTAMTVANTGNVGIGTTSPSGILHIAGATTIHGAGEGATPSAATIRGANAVGTNIAGANLTIQASNGTGLGGSGAINFQTAPVGTTGSTVNTLSTAMTITNTGNVGIGTTSPTSLFHTVDSAAKTASYTGVLHSVTDTSSTASVNKIGLDIESTGTWNGTSAVNTGLVVNATGGTTNYAATFSGGNVGIGTTAPAKAFDVAGKFQVDSNGNPVKINNIATSFPASQGSANTVLTNDGSGNLSWAVSVGTNVNATGAISALVGQKIMTDSSSAAFIITLPASASFGDEIEIFDGTNSWATNNVTLARNGLKIEGTVTDFILNISGGRVKLKYYNAAQGWGVYL